MFQSLIFKIGSVLLYSKLSQSANLYSNILLPATANYRHSDSNDSDSDSSDSAPVMKGLFQCMLGVGGMAVILWALFFFLILPCE